MQCNVILMQFNRLWCC